jgi:ABC-2 type transport system ATP-binding protein
MNHAAAIGVKNLHKTYRDGLFGRKRVDALRGVTFQVGRGEIFGLLGPNGAGKTTLIKVLLGIVRHSKGTASLLGRPPGDREGRRRVGYLPENHRIPRHHTGNTALEYYGSLSGLSVAEVKRRRGRLLAMVGLAEWGGMPVKKYSKGMQQRLGLAQALLHAPELLVLDEPTDGVDPVGRSEMRTLLQQLKEEGKTIFINSHLLQEIELVCERVVILAKGLVLREGRIDELTAVSADDITFQLAGPNAEIETALVGRERGALVRLDDDQFEVNVRLPDQRAVDECIDALRRRNIGIVTMTRNRQTLEEAFLDIVNRGEAP